MIVSSIKLAVIEATKRGEAMARDLTDDTTRQQSALDSVKKAFDFLASSFERDTQSQFEQETEHIIDTDGSLFSRRTSRGATHSKRK